MRRQLAHQHSAGGGQCRGAGGVLFRHVALQDFRSACRFDAGGIDDESAFYYRIQSPVVMIEFDHHSGVFLTNTEPAKCHIHTVIRTPNGNDYGKDLLRLHYAEVHRVPAPGRR